jgi:D-alanyl-lipoteichoic acid acyltransferase DltB (MBOAT superfamily)
MSFVSPEFALLCLLFFPMYWGLASHPRAQRAMLLLSGYALYASWAWTFVVQLWVYSVGIWALGAWLGRKPEQRLPWCVALTLSVGCLILFKYAEFLRSSLVALLDAVGFHPSLPVWDLVAPVGISFLTFQAITYLVLVARQPASVRPLSQVLLFLCFWPTLFAGPILRAERFFEQLDAGTSGQPREALVALYVIVLGAAQKLVLATWLADTWVDPVFKSPEQYGGLALIAAMVGYTLQIMLDFGGYTLIVTGLALLLGFELPVNFRQPYLARNLQDFWTRWHVSLSSFIRDYIYIPMGGNRLGFARTQANVLFGMVLSGVWHGPNWTFVVWGLLHGMGVVAVNLYRRASGPALPGWLAQTMTLLFVALAWVFFRAESLEAAGRMLQSVYFNGHEFWQVPPGPMLALLALVVVFLALSRHAAALQVGVVAWLKASSVWVVCAVLSLCVFGVVALGPSGVPGFIYYRF